MIHLLAWTQEVTARLNDQVAGTPFKGDWPDAGAPDEQQWPQLIASCKLANMDIVQLIGNFPADKWADKTNDERERYKRYGLTYEAMIAGLMQHDVYNAGQISLLNKMING